MLHSPGLTLATLLSSDVNYLVIFKFYFLKQAFYSHKNSGEALDLSLTVLEYSLKNFITFFMSFMKGQSLSPPASSSSLW